MAEDFAEHFIGHRHVGFAPHMIAKLRLDHGEGRLDVGPLVIVPQELLPVEGEIVKHLLPEATSFPAVNAFERNEGRGPMLSNNVRVFHAGLPLIGRDFPHVEVRGCRVHEVW